MRTDKQTQDSHAERREDEAALHDFLGHEARRCRNRRRLVFGIAGDPGDESVRHQRFRRGSWLPTDGNWALALSGGGIRSATFCLGVLQALARANPRTTPGLPPGVRDATPEPGGLLPHFDYVSSVSGGGFTAGFVQSLFAPRPDKSTEAGDTYRFLEEEPPGRVHGGETPTPLAWLRDNGRYLAPAGTGDILYAIGLSVRNWMGIQWVFGVAIMTVAAFLALLGATVGPHIAPELRTWWAIPLATLLGWILPVMGAYWITREIGAGGRHSLPLLRMAGVVGAGIVPLGLGAAPLFDPPPRDWDAFVASLRQPIPTWRILCLAGGTVFLPTALWAAAARKFGDDARTSSGLAVALTRCFTAGMVTTIVLVVVVGVLDLARTVLASGLSHPVLASGGTAGILAAVYHRVLKILPLLRGAGSSMGKAHGSVRRSLSAILAGVALLLAVGTMVFWTTAVYWLVLPCRSAHLPPQCYREASAVPWDAFALFFLCFLFVVAIGRWPSILNMSSYHYFYSSRLTRAYLGATNPCRTTTGGSGKRTTGPTKPDEHDTVAYDQYHANPVAPIHLINMTLNQTVDPTEQLLQRDRKGQPFVVLPCLGGRVKSGEVAYSFDNRFRIASGKSAYLSIGDWLAVSGAAVSSGLGRQTSIGAALCVTFSNARIGRWWPCRIASDSGLRWASPTYAYLWDELCGQFHGTHREYVYLTDGGHFENTATYELLRRIRHPATAIQFAVMCDCGADRDYRYDDLANLVRLARIDFGLEIEVDHHAARAPHRLASVFGTPESMGAADIAKLDNRCALLLNVRLCGKILARIVMIKPRLIRCASSDLLSYYRNNAVFPQQSTGDQFFDEEQWESYRKLGLECCNAVLALGQPLWQTVLRH
jgi:hypothetical protein